MKHPKIIFIDPRHTNVYLRNILAWTKDNPSVKKNFGKIDFSNLISQLGENHDEIVGTWEGIETDVLDAISRVTGFKWDTDKAPAIYVYQIPFFNSSSHPLFLKTCNVKSGEITRRSVGLNIGMLIHELIHNNMRGLPVDREQNERLINYTTVKILESISPVYAQDFLNFHESINISIDDSGIPESVKEGRVPIKDLYIKKEA